MTLLAQGRTMRYLKLVVVFQTTTGYHNSYGKAIGERGQMTTYNDIKMANETLKSIDLKGKDYIMVNERIKAFRMCYPEGTIETELISLIDGVCIFKATVKDVDIVLGTGHAYEKEGSSFINKTSYIENAESSAVGRALGMCGFGIDTSVASYEEVANAVKNQDIEKKANKEAVRYIKENTTPDQLAAILKQKKVERLEDLSNDVAMSICMKINERIMKDGKLG